MGRVVWLLLPALCGCNLAAPLAGPEAGDSVVTDGVALDGLVLDGTAHPDGPSVCPLGKCFAPSNVAAGDMTKGTGALQLAGQVIINTDTGQITGEGPTVIRPAASGLDPTSGVYYEQRSQSAGPELAVFAAKTIELTNGTTVLGKGKRALVLLAGKTVRLEGIIDVGSKNEKPGPGGFAGGAPATDGAGPCAGKAGAGTVFVHTDTGSIDHCNSGSGGGGHGGTGGTGGDCSCKAPDNHVGGAGGGDTCGTIKLVPLAGGSGGAGGSQSDSATSHPGPGGGGGGAIQIAAGLSITIGSTGGINAGGGPGGTCVTAGGAGGGAGGAILLEAPDVSLGNGSILAANGGGGGGGDCD